MTQGLLLIDKPTDWTSHDVVAKTRTLLPKGTKVGHSGTLDPFATGLLILLVGKKYTKRSEEFLTMDKTYEAELTWCATSTTHDPEGSITQTPNCTPPTEQQIQAIIPQFTGQIEQIPPMHSAVKIKGKKLYQLARKGQEIERKPKNITIHNIDILSHNQENATTKLNISCSSGTYIRGIARDMGKILQTGAYLTTLRRTHIGPYSAEDAQQLSSLQQDNIHEFLLK